jgi:hypothetical protein
MSRLKELSQDKVTIMMRIIGSQNICKALYYNDTNFLDQPDIAEPTGLIYDQIFPYKKVPEVSSDAKSYITMSFNRYRPVGNRFKAGYVYLYIFVNKNNMRTDYGCLRTDYIVSEIDELINQTYGLGIGKVEFNSMDDIIVNQNYLGMEISYKLCDFN